MLCLMAVDGGTRTINEDGAETRCCAAAPQSPPAPQKPAHIRRHTTSCLRSVTDTFPLFPSHPSSPAPPPAFPKKTLTAAKQHLAVRALGGHNSRVA